jgi:hypothetical protein
MKENIYMLKWYGHKTRMEDNRWPERIMTWSPEGSRRRGRPEREVGKGSGKDYEAEELNV